ncbi:hypothetical protein PV646_11180 [Streptomyces sp. ID05-26A]|nr:hypothetical protein [Streptomyces sp. ID05-26A]
MNLEDELRGALNVSAPPPTTTLDVVMKRGRRRVFAQRAGAMLGVVAVVAGIGFSAATLNQAAPPPQQADRPDAGPATVEHALTWPRVDTPPQVPYGTWTPAKSAAPPAGWSVAEIPLCNMKPSQRQEKLDLGAVVFNPEAVDAWLDQARKLLPEVTIGAATPNADSTAYEADVSDSRGTGSFRITVGRFAGTPLQAANDALWETGDCRPAQRTEIAGSVVQLHDVRPFEPFQSLLQPMRVYRVDRSVLQVELRNFGSPDITDDPKNPGMRARTGAGRPTLPLSDEQFGRLGPVFAE